MRVCRPPTPPPYTHTQLSRVPVRCCSFRATSHNLLIVMTKGTDKQTGVSSFKEDNCRTFPVGDAVMSRFTGLQPQAFINVFDLQKKPVKTVHMPHNHGPSALICLQGAYLYFLFPQPSPRLSPRLIMLWPLSRLFGLQWLSSFCRRR